MFDRYRVFLFGQRNSAKNGLDQYHIQDSAAADTQKSAFFPFVEQYDENNCNCFRKSMCIACRDIFQTIDNEKPDCCIWEYRSKVLDEFRWIFALRKNNEWDKTCCHCSKDNCRNGDDRLCCCHCHFAATSGFFESFRSAVKHTMMKIMDGTMKLLLPKIRRQTAEQISPTRAGR